MAEVANYNILIYGSEEGYQTNRAQIQLTGTSGEILAYVRFNDPDMLFEMDSHAGGVIRMHLPTTMFSCVVDLLRNERPIHVYFAHGRGFLGTMGSEPVGEGE